MTCGSLQVSSSRVRTSWSALRPQSSTWAMGCFARVETNGGAFEQVNLMAGENPNLAVRAFCKPFNEVGIKTHMLDRGLNALRMYPVPDDVRALMYKVKHAQGARAHRGILLEDCRRGDCCRRRGDLPEGYGRYRTARHAGCPDKVDQDEAPRHHHPVSRTLGPRLVDGFHPGGLQQRCRHHRHGHRAAVVG